MTNTLLANSVKPQSKRYIVLADMGNHKIWDKNDPRLVSVKETNDYQSALSTTNFWDERVNTFLVDRVQEQHIQEWHARIEQEAFDALPIADQLQRVEEKFHRQLDAAFSALEAKLMNRAFL